jgi:hypothetical protein
MNAIALVSQQKQPSMADLRAEIERYPERYGKRPEDFVQALDRFAKDARRNLASVPANLTAVNIILEGMLWQNLGYDTEKAFWNWRSSVRGAVRKSANPSRQPGLLLPKHYPAEWKAWMAEVMAAVKDGAISIHTRSNLSAIAAWAGAFGIAPEAFDDDAAVSMAGWYLANRPSGGRRPYRRVRDAIGAWNHLAAKGIAGCEEVRTPIGRSKFRNIQLNEMPASLLADLNEFVRYQRTRGTIEELAPAPEARPAARQPGAGLFEHLRGRGTPDIATPNRATKDRAGKPLGKVSEYTVKNTKQAFRELITAAVESGRVPLVEGIRLKAFLTKDAMIDGFNQIGRRQIEAGTIDEDTEAELHPASCHALGAKVCAMATWAGIDTDELQEMRLTIRSESINTDSVKRMPEHRRRILEEMDDPIKVLAWFKAPSALWERAEAERKAGSIHWEMVRDAETAFLAWLMTRIPMRRKNAAQLTIRMLGKEEAMIRMARFEGEETIIVIPARFVKNGRDYRFKVRGEGLKMLKGILAKGGYREMAMKLGGFANSEFLFVGDSCSFAKKDWLVRGHRSMATLGAGYRDRMREFGIPATLHMARHISAQIALDFDPEAKEIVANLLGSSLRTVEAHYLADRTSKAAAAFDEIIKGSIKQAMKMLTEGKAKN